MRGRGGGAGGEVYSRDTHARRQVNETRLLCSRKSDKVHPAGGAADSKRSKGKRKRRKRKGKSSGGGAGDGSRRRGKGRGKRGSKASIASTAGARAAGGAGAGGAGVGGHANGSGGHDSRALTNVVASMAASQEYDGDSSSEYETGSEWGGQSTYSGAAASAHGGGEHPVILQDGTGQSCVCARVVLTARGSHTPLRSSPCV